MVNKADSQAHGKASSRQPPQMQICQEHRRMHWLEITEPNLHLATYVIIDGKCTKFMILIWLEIQLV